LPKLQLRKVPSSRQRDEERILRARRFIVLAELLPQARGFDPYHGVAARIEIHSSAEYLNTYYILFQDVTGFSKGVVNQISQQAA
jgi:hypothetical protein